MDFPWVHRNQYGRVAIVTPPTGAVIQLPDIKLHLRVEQNDEDALITGMVAAATEELDAPGGWLGRSLLTRTLRLSLDAYPHSVVYLPGPPVQSITRVEYREEVGGPFIEIPSDEYGEDLTAEPGLIWAIERWPFNIARGPDSFRVEYVAGYGVGADVPELIKQYIRVRVGDMYRDREGTVLAVNQQRFAHVERSLDNMRVR